MLEKLIGGYLLENGALLGDALRRVIVGALIVLLLPFLCVCFILLVELFDVLHAVLIVFLVHWLLLLAAHLRLFGSCILPILYVILTYVDRIIVSAAFAVLVQPSVGCRAVDAELLELLEVVGVRGIFGLVSSLVFCVCWIVGAGCRALLLVFIFVFFIGGLVFRQTFKVELRNVKPLQIAELGPALQIFAHQNILEAIIGVKTQSIKLFILRCLHSLICSLSVFLVVLAHDLLEAVGLDELHSVLLVDFVDGDALILKCEEEVDELRNFVCVIQLFFLRLLQFSLLLLQLYHQV